MLGVFYCKKGPDRRVVRMWKKSHHCWSLSGCLLSHGFHFQGKKCTYEVLLMVPNFLLILLLQLPAKGFFTHSGRWLRKQRGTVSVRQKAYITNCVWGNARNYRSLKYKTPSLSHAQEASFRQKKLYSFHAFYDSIKSFTEREVTIAALLSWWWIYG